MAAVALLILPAVTHGAWAAEPLNLRIGWAVVPGQLTAVLFAKKDILKHYGKSYTVQTLHFRGSTPQITGLGTGDLDIASLAFSSFGLAIQNAHMQDIRVVADLYQDGAKGHYSSEYMVRSDSNIHKVEDLKGKVVASNGFGGAVDMALRKELRDHGLEVNRDYQLVEIQFPNMMSAIQEKKIDLGGLVAPFSIDARKSGHFRSLFTVRDAMGPTQLTFFVMRAPFIAAHRAALVDFFEDVERATQWYLDPKNRKEAIDIVAQFTKKPASEYADWLFTKKDYYHDPYARPDLEALQRNINTQKELGFLKINIDVKKYADLSLVEEAAKRLK
jgi:NitT/TauT family transport system substrate-binding protein